MKHFVTICYTDFSHVQPTIEFLSNLVQVSNWICTIILPKNCPQQLPTYSNQKQGLFVHCIPAYESNPNRLVNSDNQLINLKRNIKQAIQELGKIDGILIELFAACCYTDLNLEIPKFMFCTTSAMAFVHRYSRFINSNLNNEITCELNDLNPIKARNILLDPLKLTFMENQFRPKPIENNAQYFSFDQVSRHVVQCLSQCKGVIINDVKTLYDMELSYFPIDLKFYFCGPSFIPHLKPVENQVLKWLDQQPINSIVYIAFGSLENQSVEQMVEIYNALKATDTKFLWTVPLSNIDAFPDQSLVLESSVLQSRVLEPLREPLQETQSQEPSVLEHLDSLVVPWSPQRHVLQHRSIQAFISHCGWNSFIENLFSGNPIIGWPLFADQKMNALYAVSRHFGLLINDTKLGGRLVGSGEIENALKEIKKPEYRINALAMSEKVRQWDFLEVIEEFVSDLGE